MANVRTRFWQVILALSFLCFCYSALASEGVGGSGVEVGGVPIAPPSGWAAVVLVGLVVGSWAVRKFSSVAFFHSTGGAAVAGFLSGAIPAVIQVVQENGLSARAIEAAVVGAVFSFVASDNGSNTSDEQKAKVQAMRVDGGTTPPTPPITKVSVLLPFLFVLGALATGCHGFKAPEYATLATMAGAAEIAAQQLPSICEGQENAAVDAATSKTDATNVSGAIHARCVMAITSLDGVGKGLKSARDAVHDAAAGADLSSALPWLKTITKQYCDLVPLLSDFKVNLPTFPGVC